MARPWSKSLEGKGASVPLNYLALSACSGDATTRRLRSTCIGPLHLPTPSLRVLALCKAAVRDNTMAVTSAVARTQLGGRPLSARATRPLLTAVRWTNSSVAVRTALLSPKTRVHCYVRSSAVAPARPTQLCSSSPRTAGCVLAKKLHTRRSICSHRLREDTS